jgi:hypothetical protein
MNDMTDTDGSQEARATRRAFLRYAAAGIATAGLAGTGLAHAPRPGVAVEVAAGDGFLDLHVNDGFVPMVDGSLVYMRGFGERSTGQADPNPSLTISPRIFMADGRLLISRGFPAGAEEPPDGRPAPAGKDPSGPGLHLVRRGHWASFFPRRTIVAQTGSTIRLRVRNGLGQPHQLRVDNVVDSGPIAPGATAELVFKAPAPGTYVYHDPGNAPVERVLGLSGVLLVTPARDPWRLTPGGVEFERQWLWICHDIDPEWGRLARMGVAVNPAKTPCLPRYFTLNDRSGIFSIGVSTDEVVNLATHEETIVSGSARRTDVRNFSLAGTQEKVVTGQLLRLVNTGVAVHQLHFHGNHVWTLRRNGADFSRRKGVVDADGHVRLQQWEDVVELDPFDRKEIVLPVKPPPDALDIATANQDCDWHYPMHCHAEMSQTASGRLYPGGMVADWILASPLR